MARSAYPYTSFTGGELSKDLDGRIDLEKYKVGCKTIENMIVYPHGVASRRPGTKFIAEAKRGTNGTAHRLIPFEFSTTQTYMLEFGDEYVRFFKDNGIITKTGLNISAITKANPGVVTSATHGLTAGDYVILDGIVGMTELNGRQFRVGTVGSSTTFQLLNTDGTNFNTTSLTTYASGGVVYPIYQITSPYPFSVLPDLKFAQSADVMYITHPSYAIRKLSRTAHTSWSFSTPTLTTGTDFIVSAITQANPGVVSTILNNGLVKGDFITFTGIGGMTNINGVVHKVGELKNKITISGITKANPGVVTTSAAHGLIAGDSFDITDVVGMTQLNGNSFKVGTVPSTTTFQLQNGNGINIDTTDYTTFVSGTLTGPDQHFVLQDKDGTDIDTSSYSSFSGSTGTVTKLNNPVLNLGTNNYPSCVSFFEQRLVFANTNNNPQTIWFSQSGDYENFTEGTDPDDAMNFTIASNKVNAIRYLAASRSLLIGTTGAEFLVTGSDSVNGLSPTNINIRKQSAYGSANKDAITVGNLVLFIHRAKRKIRELTYNYDSDNYIAPDLTVLADHITDSLVTDFAYQQEPASILWVVRTDGVLAGLTYQRTENVIAWHRHILGGMADTGKQSVTKKIPLTVSTSTVSVGDNAITKASHGLSTGDVVSYYADSDPIGGLRQDLFYYIIAVDSNVIQFATTEANATAGTAVDLLSVVSGKSVTHYLYKEVNVRTSTFWSAAHGFGDGDTVFYTASLIANKFTGLEIETPYRVITVDGNSFKLIHQYDFEDFKKSGLNYINTNYVAVGTVSTTSTTHKWLTNAKVKTIATIPTDNAEDELYMIVERYVNGATVNYVEFMTPFDYGNSQEDAFYVDSGLTYSGGKTTSITGLHHLEGALVNVLADGATHTNETVSSSGITLNNLAEKVHVGFNYKSVLQTMRIESGADDGTAQGKIKRIHGVTVRLNDSLGCKVGPDLKNLETIPFRNSSLPISSPIPLFTGDKDVEFRGDYEKDGHVVVVQDQPLPLNLVALFPRLNTFDA
mgnify:FL=1